jgi:hypothetical protein
LPAQLGSTFWASDRRLRLRSESFWSDTLALLQTDDEYPTEEDPTQVNLEGLEEAVEQEACRGVGVRVESDQQRNRHARAVAVSFLLVWPLVILRCGRLFSGQFVSFASSCLESSWHFLLGQPLYHFQPAFETIEELPKVRP